MCLEQYLKDSKHSMLAKINEQIIILDNSGINFRFTFIYFPYVICLFKILKVKPRVNNTDIFYLSWEANPETDGKGWLLGT